MQAEDNSLTSVQMRMMEQKATQLKRTQINHHYDAIKHSMPPPKIKLQIREKAFNTIRKNPRDKIRSQLINDVWHVGVDIN